MIEDDYQKPSTFGNTESTWASTYHLTETNAEKNKLCESIVVIEKSFSVYEKKN